MRSTFIFVLLLLLGSCNRESGTLRRVVILNKSTHSISCYRYDHPRGKHYLDFRLAPGTAYTDTSMSSQNPDTYDPALFAYSDSAQVIFDNRETIMHYLQESDQFQGHHYPFNSSRNLLNINSYQISINKNKSWFRIITYTYTFTDRDYEDAKL